MSMSTTCDKEVKAILHNLKCQEGKRLNESCVPKEDTNVSTYKKDT